MKNLAILVVDDDPVIRRLLQQRLANERYQVEVAEDGYVAERMLRKKSWDVVLTDLMMPGDIGGIEVLEIAKSINMDTEVLLITAHSSVGTAVEAMKKGAVDYLEKPINFDELFLRLDKIYNMRSLLRNAEDLQVAMSTTESQASQTIQNLEILATQLQEKLDGVEALLSDHDMLDDEKIEQALDLLVNK